MSKTDGAISRFDLIAAGASFFVESFSSYQDPRSLALPLCFMDNITYGDIHGAQLWITLHPGCDFAKIFPFKTQSHPPLACFKSSNFSEVRAKLSKFINVADPEASAALLMSWSLSEFLFWPKPAWATEHGLSLDALAYSAVQKGESNAVRMYLDAGANPMKSTYCGDCSARLGVASRMLDIFGTKEFLNVRSELHGETGLFDLAQDHDVDILKIAYRLGADPEVRNHAGKTVLDMLDNAYQDEVRAVISQVQAMELRRAVPGSLPSTRRDDVRRRL